MTRFVAHMVGISAVMAAAVFAVWLASMVFAWPQELPRGPFLGGPQYNPYGMPTDKSKWAGSALKPWFDSLKSNKGLCCSFADGVTIKDVDWDTINIASADKPDVRFRVRIDGKWIVVPPDAVVTVPNLYKRAVVWPYQGGTGELLIRCFIPGTES